MFGTCVGSSLPAAEQPRYQDESVTDPLETASTAGLSGHSCLPPDHPENAVTPNIQHRQQVFFATRYSSLPFSKLSVGKMTLS